MSSFINFQPELRKCFYIVMMVYLWTVDQGNAGQRHQTDIVQRPDDVIGAECGEEIRMTCIAKAREQTKDNPSPPDIEWWYRDSSMTSSPQKISAMDKEGRVEVRIEEFYVVRSTLVVRGAKPTDEGVYQCRASSSPSRYKDGVNLYQHWKIEEAPVADIRCGEAMTTTPMVHVIPATSYNRSKLDDIITKTMTSLPVKTSRPLSVSFPRVATTTYKATTPTRTNKRRQSRRSTASTRSNGRGTGSPIYLNNVYQHVTALSIMTSLLYLAS